MSALTGTQIKNTYQSLLKLINNGSLQTSTPIIVSDGLGNPTPLQLSETRISTQYSALNNGLSLDFIGNTFSIGDYDFNSNGTVLQVIVPSELIKTTHSFLDKGLRVNFTDKVYALGDYNSYDNGSKIVIDDANEDISIEANVNITLTSDNTSILIDGNTNKTVITTDVMQLTGAGLENPTPPANPNPVTYLVVVVNGLQYKIGLLNP